MISSRSVTRKARNHIQGEEPAQQHHKPVPKSRKMLPRKAAKSAALMIKIAKATTKSTMRHSGKKTRK